MPTLLTPTGTRVGGIRCQYRQGIVSREEDWHFLVDGGRNNDGSPVNLDRSEILFNTPGLPLIGSTIYAGMLCIGGDANRKDENASIFDVVMTFSNDVTADDPNNGPNGAQQGDPTLWIPVRRVLWETKTEWRDVDCSTPPKKLANSAREPFEEKMQIQRHCLAWEFVQFEPLSVTDTLLLERNEVMNLNPWPTSNSKPAKTWFCRVLESDVGFYAGYRCRRTLYRVAYDEFKWTDKRLDIGTKYLSSGKPVEYMVLGIQGKYPLNGSGARRLAEDGSVISGGGEPAELEFNPFPVRDFAPWFRF